MGRVFLPQAQATPYTPKVGETFNDVVARCDKATPAITPEEVAQFNWGAISESEVLRALVELVGCQEINALDPFECTLNPKNGLKGKILLPRVWKKSGLAYEKVHKLTVKKSLPATAISITSLDAWFLPGEETCGIFYQLEGIKERAQLLDFDVYASNYCKATAQVNGDFVDYTYSDTPDVPILQKSVSTEAIQRERGEVEDWNGESEAASGVLAKRAGGTRYINAASSPYTVVLRYSKSAAKTAFINLNSFWPRWSGEGSNRSLVSDSLKVKWTTKSCPGGLQGQIQLFNKDKIIWRQYLPPAKCGNGNQEFDLPAEAKSKIEEDFMPYRVQIQLHTDKDTDNGFAIAAMHTEVRLFTHPEIGTYGEDHEKEPQVLPFALAPYYAGAAPPEDSSKGRKLRLAKAGYHPGPVADGENELPYLQALRECQRDHTEPGSNPPKRILPDAGIEAPTKAVVTQLPPGKRPLFADQNRQDLTNDAAIRGGLNDKDTQAILWVDDRHSYTETDVQTWLYEAPNMAMMNYRGLFGTDLKQEKDEQSICRPWIPLEVSLPILRKTDALYSSSVPDMNEASRAATGPIRVDWTFRDLPYDDNVDTTEYNTNRARPRRYLKETFESIKGTQNGKDAWNCTTALGGIRGGNYYLAPFGTAADSLMPWKALPDSGAQSVCSVVHDDLAQDQKQLFQTHVGKAGVYFHPSIIAGDGYQFRAQVSFRDLPSGSTHPNWKVLRERYDLTKLPQAHSAPLRLWRKDTVRAGVFWGPPGREIDWEGKLATLRKYYKPAMVHFATEGKSLAGVPLASLLAKDTYINVVSSMINATLGPDVKSDRFRPKAEMEFSPHYLWPWWKAKHLGINAVPDSAVHMHDYENTFLNGEVWPISYVLFTQPLIISMLAQAERQTGLLRGRFFVQYLPSPPYWKEKYQCTHCHSQQILLELTGEGGSGKGEPCRLRDCPGTLVQAGEEVYTCNVCSFNTVAPISRELNGTRCNQRCTGMLEVVEELTSERKGMFTSIYQCNSCGQKYKATERNQGGRAGTNCARTCAGQMTREPDSRSASSIQPGALVYLNTPDKADPLGAIWFNLDATQDFTAHEVGHTKQLEHAGKAPGGKTTQHDSTRNAVDPDWQSNPPQKAGDGQWDYTCLMSYTYNLLSGDLNSGYFCGKCILKLRGWKVESGLPSPAPGLADPADESS
jgi:hypothetical protein